MSKLLINESPLVVLPSLAKLLGLSQAILVQQIHYYSTRRDAVKADGHSWVRCSYEDLKEICSDVWEKNTLRNLCLELTKSGILVSAQLSTDRFDRTKYYRVNVQALEMALSAIKSDSTEKGSFDGTTPPDLPDKSTHDLPGNVTINNCPNSVASLNTEREENVCEEGKTTHTRFDSKTDLTNPNDDFTEGKIESEPTELEQAIMDVCLYHPDTLMPHQWAEVQVVAGILQKVREFHISQLERFRDFWAVFRPNYQYGIRPNYIREHWGTFVTWLHNSGG